MDALPGSIPGRCDEPETLSGRGPIQTNIGAAHAWREGEHDDLVLAVALACWYARARPGFSLAVALACASTPRCYTNPRTGKRFTTKNGRDRLLPMTPLAAQIAARHLEAHATEDPYAPVLRNATTGRRLEKDVVTKRFKSFSEEAGLPDSITFHSLRHSHASYLMMLGVNVLTIKRLLGHATLALLDTYAELCEEYLMGDARPLQRQMLDLLCPGLPESVLDRILPSRRSLLSALSGQSISRIQSLQAVIPMEDVLFSGLVYQAATATVEGSLMDQSAIGFLETF